MFDAESLAQAVAQALAQAPPAQVQPAPEHEAKWPYWLAGLGQGADAATTIAAIKQGGFRETNPLGTAGVLASKAAVTPLIMWLMHHLNETGHPTAAKVSGSILGGSGAGLAGYNIAQMTKRRSPK